MLWIVAEADETKSFFSLVGPLGIVLVVGTILVLGVAALRRYLKTDDTGPARDFSLGDLRRLKAEGKITQEELDKAKNLLVGRTQAELAKERDPAGRKQGDPRAEVK